MTADPHIQFTPTSSYLRISVTRPPDRTSSGLWLPEISQKRPAEGTVVGVGPGRLIPGMQKRTVIWPIFGDIVLFDPAAFIEITDAYDGLVAAEDVLGIMHPDTTQIRPENDWIAVDPQPLEPQSWAGVIIPERVREPSRSGEVLDYGPGLVRLAGPLTGTRRTVHATLGLSESQSLIGRTVWWSGEMKSFHLGGKFPCVMVKANDLFAIDEERRS